jgi:hypothetical protein
MKTYYTQEGKYQQQYDRLSKLIPAMGRADTLLVLLTISFLKDALQ